MYLISPQLQPTPFLKLPRTCASDLAGRPASTNTPHTNLDNRSKYRVNNIRDIPSATPYLFIEPDMNTEEARKIKDSVPIEEYSRFHLDSQAVLLLIFGRQDNRSRVSSPTIRGRFLASTRHREYTDRRQHRVVNSAKVLHDDPQTRPDHHQG